MGDWVEYTDFGDQTGIERIRPRMNSLIRPPVANVDQALIVMSAKAPDFSCTLVDRILFLIVNASIKPVLCITKMDLVHPDDPVHGWMEDYRQSGYEVVLSGREELDENLAGVLRGKVTVLTGQSLSLIHSSALAQVLQEYRRQLSQAHLSIDVNPLILE